MAERKLDPKKLRILIVDDDDQITTLLTSLLHSEGYWSLINTKQPFRVLEYVQKNLVDIVILDWKIPDVPNLGLLRALFKQKKDIAIIMISGFAEEQNIGEAMKAGAVAYIKKPFSKSDLVDALEKALAFLRSPEEAIHRRETFAHPLKLRSRSVRPSARSANNTDTTPDRAAGPETPPEPNSNAAPPEEEPAQTPSPENPVS